MKLQHQPNPASCLVTSFAMVLNVPVEDLIRQIGHDGMEVLFPENDYPNHLRGFHIQELIWACYEREYLAIPFEPCPVLESNGIIRSIEPFKWIKEIMAERQGVLIGTKHAVAWDCNLCYDPAIPQIFSLDSKDFEIRTFYVVESNPNYKSKNSGLAALPL